MSYEETAGGPAGSKDFEVPAILSESLVLFPQMEIITAVNDEGSLSALREAMKGQQILAFIPSSTARITSGTIGTLAIVKKSIEVENGGARNFELKGMWRIRVKKFVESSGYPKVLFERAEEIASGNTMQASVLVKRVQDQIDEFVKLIPGIPIEIISLLKHTLSPGNLADICANSPEFTYEQRIELLKTLDEEEWLEKVSKLFEKQLTAIRKVANVDPISECDKCLELADNAFEADPSKRAEIAVSFLNHVVLEHTGELLALLAEKYGPIFLNKRSLR
ncbi:MAG: LON peptidase substrate-binding domain-containing protein [Thaumarchaeota archaeon]|nr:LON peptidase substrate-binding domain-containing protein [Nitrososphaerota archaeon]